MNPESSWANVLRQLQAAERKVDERLRSQPAAAATKGSPEAARQAGSSSLARLDGRIERLAPIMVRADNQQRQAAERTRQLISQLRTELTTRLGSVGFLVLVVVVTSLVHLLRR